MASGPRALFGRAGAARPNRLSGAVFAGYLALASLYLGPRVVAHPERTQVGGLFTDPQIFVWSFAWWPHAILHGVNPFYSHAIWAPDGFNLAWATSVPGLAVVFAPITLLFGPILSFNLACILMPALAAWTAFLLCRRLTGAVWPSIVGGYLFGFSSYVLAAELSHIHTAAVFLVPLAVLLILRFLDGELSARALAALLGVLLAAQMSLSTELLFTLTVALLCSLAVGAVFVPARRGRLKALLIPLAAAYLIAAILAAPFVFYILSGAEFRPPLGSETFVADALNFVVPTKASLGGWWTGGLARNFPANDVERGVYLGLPTLLIVGWFGLRRRRMASARFLLVSWALATIAALGSWLTVDGRRVVTLPWIHVAHQPLFESIMPVRLGMFGTLAAAVMVALWAASEIRPAWLRVLLPCLAVVAIMPNLSWQAWARAPEIPGLFTTGKYRDCLSRGENVLTFPVGPRGDAMSWQAEAGFWFRMAGGYISNTIPPSFTRPPSLVHLTGADNPPEVTLAAVLELARLKSITTIVVAGQQGATWRRMLRPLGPPRAVGGALLYHIPGSATFNPAC